jgi:hypothetical protein
MLEIHRRLFEINSRQGFPPGNSAREELSQRKQEPHRGPPQEDAKLIVGFSGRRRFTGDT